MNEKDLKALFDELDRLDREITTPEQARAHLYSMGMVDEHGELAPQYRPESCP